jgi:hypothetical protein
MEPECSLTCSQEFATGPYPESDGPRPHPHTWTENHFNIILQFTPTPPEWPLVFRFSTNILI